MLGEPKINMPNSPSLVLLVVMTIVLTISWQWLSGPLVFDDLPNLSPIFNETPSNCREFIFLVLVVLIRHNEIVHRFFTSCHRAGGN